MLFGTAAVWECYNPHLENLVLTSTKSTREAEECLVSIATDQHHYSGLHQVNCDMELAMERDGHKGGWIRIAKFDTSKGDPCPSGWTRMTTPGTSEEEDSAKMVCQSDYTGDNICNSTIFTTYNVTFNKICGQVKGYQKGCIRAFYSPEPPSINERYVGGVSITLGDPCKHVWTYATGLSDNAPYPDENCPCTSTDPPLFTGNNYYCESGNWGWYYDSARTIYTQDAL